MDAVQTCHHFDGGTRPRRTALGTKPRFRPWRRLGIFHALDPRPSYATWNAPRGIFPLDSKPIKALLDTQYGGFFMTKKHTESSEERQRQRIITFRVLEEEYDAISSLAEDAGLSVSAFIRKQATGRAGVRSLRKKTAFDRDIEKLMGELHQVALAITRIGTNINQSTYQLNAGDFPVPQELVSFFTAFKSDLEQAQNHIDKSMKPVQETHKLMLEVLRHDN